MPQINHLPLLGLLFIINILCTTCTILYPGASHMLPSTEFPGGRWCWWVFKNIASGQANAVFKKKKKQQEDRGKNKHNP